MFLNKPPTLILSTITPLPKNVPKLMLTSLITNKHLQLINKINPHSLIGNTEFTLLDSVPPQIKQPENPFNNHYKYYSLYHNYPIFKINQIAHHHDTIFPTTIVNKPKQKNFFINNLLQKLLSPLFPLMIPTIKQL